MVEQYNSNGLAGPGRVGESAHYGGQMRQSSLRSSRSPGRRSQDPHRSGSAHGGSAKPLSPLRSSVAQRHGGPSRPGLPPVSGAHGGRHGGATDTIEDEMHERRRQQQLRAQI